MSKITMPGYSFLQDTTLISYLPVFANRHLLTYSVIVSQVLCCTLISFVLMPYVDASDLIMVYLLGVVVIATWQGERYGPARISALLSTLAFDFFFTAPHLSLSIAHGSDIITLLVMFMVAQLISDLTIRVRRYTEAAKVVQLQADTERFRNILLSSISHDLRTPLTSIMGSASILLQSYDDFNAHMRTDLLQNIYDESDRLNRLVNNILRIVRLESGTVKLSKQLHIVEEIIGSALDKVEKQIGTRRIQTNIPPALPRVAMDNILIQQVLMNLLENALKFTPEKSVIEISAEMREKKIVIRIADNGPGIKPDEIDTIFDKFNQGRQFKTKGIGLGLAICKAIVEMHGGEIWAVNRSTGGAMFCFNLPLGL